MSADVDAQEEFDLYGDFGGQDDKQHLSSAASGEPAPQPTPIPALIKEEQQEQQQQPPVQPAKQQHRPQQSKPASPKRANSVSNTAAATGGSSSVYVGQLQWWTTDAELETACSDFGHVEEVTVFEDRANGKSKGYALIRFADSSSAQACKAGLNGRVLNDKKCVVTLQTSSTAKAVSSIPGTGQGRGSVAYTGRGQAQASVRAPGRTAGGPRPPQERGLGRMGAMALLSGPGPIQSIPGDPAGMPFQAFQGPRPPQFQQGWTMGGRGFNNNQYPDNQFNQGFKRPRY